MVDKQILWLASEIWADDIQASFHITNQLQASYPVLYCNTIGIRRPALKGSDLTKAANRIKRIFQGPQKIDRNLWVYSPFGVPASMGKWTTPLNNFLVFNQIKRTMHTLGFDPENVIVWVCFPGWAPILKTLDIPPECTITHFFDRWEAFGRVDKDFILDLRDEILSRSGAVLSSGVQLADELKSIHPKVFYAPHGLDLKTFSQEQELDPPVTMQAIPRPIAGYFGKINSFWLNFELLRHCARHAPHISWVIIGFVDYISEEDQPIVDELMQLPNVYFPGYVNHQELPRYSVHFDLGLMPSKDNSLTRSSAPLKLTEYLALGLPIVSTIPQQYGNLANYITVTGSDPEDFLQAVLEQIDASDSERQRRRAAVSTYGWAQMVVSYLEALRAAGIEI